MHKTAGSFAPGRFVHGTITISMKMYRKKQQAGLTLIEMLVVIGIIGLLTSVVLFSVSGARERARDSQRFSDVKSLQLAVELYKEANGSYPTEGGNQLLSQVSGLVPVFIATLPEDPKPTSGNVGQYRYANVGNGYVLIVGTIEGKGSVNHCYLTSRGTDSADIEGAIGDYGAPSSDFVECDSL